MDTTETRARQTFEDRIDAWDKTVHVQHNPRQVKVTLTPERQQRLKNFYGQFYTIHYETLPKACLDTDPAFFLQDDLPEQEGDGLYPPSGSFEEPLLFQDENPNDDASEKAVADDQPSPPLANLVSPDREQHPLEPSGNKEFDFDWPEWTVDQDNLTSPYGQFCQPDWPVWPPTLANLTTLPDQFGYPIYMDTEAPSERVPEMTAEGICFAPLLPSVSACVGKHEQDRVPNDYRYEKEVDDGQQSPPLANLVSPDRNTHSLEPSGSNDVDPNWPIWPGNQGNLTTPGQFGHPIYTETTAEMTSETTAGIIYFPLHLLRSASARVRKREEEKDKKQKQIDLESFPANPNAHQQPHPANVTLTPERQQTPRNSYGQSYTIHEAALPKACRDGDPILFLQNDLPEQERDGLHAPSGSFEGALSSQHRVRNNDDPEKGTADGQYFPPLAIVASSDREPPPLEPSGNKDFNPDWPKWPPSLANLATPPGQFGHPIYTETTSEMTSETTAEIIYFPPHLLRSASARVRKREEEEDKKQKQIDLGGLTANPNAHQQPHPATDDSPQSPQPRKETAMKTTESRETQIFEDMIDAWNETVHARHNPHQRNVTLTPERQQMLRNFSNRFLRESTGPNQLQKWKDYCTLIANSRYLAGQNPSGFKASFNWALVPDNALKVWEGAIYDKPEPVKVMPDNLPWEQFSEELARNLPSSPYLASWLKISMTLAQMIGQPKYRSWFLRVVLRELTPTKAVLSVEGRFSKDYILSHFFSEIRCAIQTHYPTVTQIDVETSCAREESRFKGGVA